MKARLIKVNGKIYHLTLKEYDPFQECYFYYTQEGDEPFCDLSDDIEEI